MLDRLEEERDAINLGEFGLKTADDIRGADVALGERHEIDLDAAAVQRGVCAVDADEGGKAFDRGILENDIGKILLAAGHGPEGNVLHAHRAATTHAPLPHREKPSRNHTVEQHSPHTHATT